MLDVISMLLHVACSGAAFGLLGYLQYGVPGTNPGQWYDPSQSINIYALRAQIVGFLVSLWFLFQGPSFLQVSSQKQEKDRCSGLFFYLLWLGEVIFLVLAVFVGLGGNWNNYVLVYNSGESIPIACLTLFTATAAIAAFQFIYFIVKGCFGCK